MPDPTSTCPRGHSYVVPPGSSADCPICAGATAAPGDAPTVANLPTRDDAPPASAEESPDQHAGPFRIVREHARGGLGRVSVAVDEALRREVAVKQMRPETADHFASRMRFVAEAVITGQLEHPGIVPVYAFGLDAEGLPYYAMRFVRGQTFDAAIRAYHAKPDRLAFRDLLRRFVSVCQAIAYAHARHVIHRDIKPQNVMLGEYGETLILDWGLAKRLDMAGDAIIDGDAPTRVKVDDVPSSATLTPASGGTGSAPLTLEGSALGTPGYMAPEQAAGETARVGPPADVYSLGATLMHVLDGKPPPHRGAPDARLDELMERRDMPKPLVAVCRRAMSSRPTDRYSSADELAREIDRWLADEPVLAWREPLAVRLGRWARRHRSAIVITTILLVTSVALTMMSVFLGQQSRVAEQQRTIAEQQHNLAELQLTSSLVAQGEALVLAERVDLARARIDQAFDALTRLGARTLPADLALGHLFGRSPPAVNTFAGLKVPGLSGASFGTDGRTVYLTGTDAERGQPLLVVVDAATGRAVAHRPGDPGLGAARAFTGLAIAPDGVGLALAGDDGNVWLWDIRSGRVRTILPTATMATGFKESADSGSIAVTTQPISAVAVARALCFSHDSSLVLAGRDDGTVTVWRATDGAIVRAFDSAPFGSRPARQIGVHSLALAADGNTLMVGGRDHFVMLFDMRSGEPTNSVGPQVRPNTAAAITPDGRRVVTACEDQFVHLYDVRRDDTHPEMLRGLDAPVTAVAVSPDGSQIAAAGAERKVFTWPSSGGGQSVRVFQGASARDGPVRFLQYAPDGRTLLAATEDGALCLWDTWALRQTQPFGGLSYNLAMTDPRPSTRGSSVETVARNEQVVAISPDGRLGLHTSAYATVLFDVATSRVLKRFPHGAGRPTKLLFRADGREVMIVGPGTSARAYDLVRLSGAPPTSMASKSPSWLSRTLTASAVRPVKQFDAPARLTCGALARDGTMLVADERGTIHVLSPASDDGTTTSTTFAADLARVNDLAISADGTQAITGDEDGSVTQWDVARRAKIGTLTPGHEGPALSVAFAGANATRALTGGSDGTIRVWDLRLRQLLGTLHGHDGSVNSLAVSEDGALAISGGADHSMKVWDLTRMGEVHAYQNFLATIRSVGLDANARFAVCGADDGWGATWDFGFVPNYRGLEPQLAEAFRAAAAAPASGGPDSKTLAVLGRWYEFRGQWAWAADLLESARNAGASDVSTLALARCYWQSGRLAEARVQFERAIRENEAPEPYLRLCINALDGGQP